MKEQQASAHEANHIPWRAVLESIASRPGLYLGGPEDRLTRTTIGGAVSLLIGTTTFLSVRSGAVLASPHQYLCTFESGPLRPEIEQLLEWDTIDILIRAFGEAWKGVRALSAKWTVPFQSNVNHFHEAVSAIQVADFGIVGIRNSQGLFWQLYQDGWPLTPPLCTSTALKPVGFIVGGSISSQWFGQLPFTESFVSSAIPETAKGRVRIRWSPSDSCLPQYSTRLLRSDRFLNDWVGRLIDEF